MLWRFVLCSIAFSTASQAADLTVEDRDFARVPRDVAAAVRSHAAFSEYQKAGCILVGKKVQLGASGGVDWVTTTAEGCGWAAASAPIWIVHRTSGTQHVVLHTNTYDVTLGKETQNGLKHLALATGTAGWYLEELLKYNGRKYVVVRSRYVDLQDPVQCRRNKDVCEP